MRYDYIVHLDADMCFQSNPDETIPSAQFFGATFPNMLGVFPHTYLWSGIFVAKPSEKVFSDLVKRAREGNYLPITQTEQDILDVYFPSQWFGGNLREFFQFVHPCDNHAPWKHECRTMVDPSPLLDMNCTQFFDTCLKYKWF